MTTTFDSHKNLAYTSVATAPSPATSGTSLVVTTGTGSLFPTPPFNAVCWPGGGATASQANAEYVRVTAISTDTFTIVRAQEGSAAQSIGVGYQLALVTSKKVITDLENAINATLGGVLTGTLPNPGLASGSVGTTQLAAGAVGQAQLATSAITQVKHATGVTSGPTTTSATPVNLPDMSVSITTTGGDLSVLLVATISNSVGGGAILSTQLALDGGAAVSPTSESSPGAAYANCLVNAWHFSGVAAGAHTVVGQWATSAGTATAQGTSRVLIVEEVR